MILFLMGTAVFAVSLCREREYRTAALRAALAAYLYFILAVTLIGRTPKAAPQAELMPLWSWMKVLRGQSGRWYLQEIGLNVMLFVPFGALLEMNAEIPVSRAWRIGLGVSCVIETVQYVACLGLFEWDDMLHNSLGCLIGAAAVTVIRRTRAHEWSRKGKKDSRPIFTGGLKIGM